MLTLLGMLASGEAVFDRHKSHLTAHPEVLPLLVGALLTIESRDREYIQEEIDFGRIIGSSIRVETGPDDEIIFAQRPGREGLSRFVKNRKETPCSTMAVVLRKGTEDHRAYILMTAFVGILAPPEPWDKNADERSVPFWNSNALVWDTSSIIIPGTETTKSPW
ncbi:MAG: hypothetical protein V4436_01235 [Patescibacteria group bacterium]